MYTVHILTIYLINLLIFIGISKNQVKYCSPKPTWCPVLLGRFAQKPGVARCFRKRVLWVPCQLNSSECFRFKSHFLKGTFPLVNLLSIGKRKYIHPNVLTAGAPGSHMDGGPSVRGPTGPGRRATSHSAAGLRNEVELSRLKAPVEQGTSLRKTTAPKPTWIFLWEKTYEYQFVPHSK